MLVRQRDVRSVSGGNGGPAPVPAEVWSAGGMAEAIAARDITGVYRILQEHRISQRRIGALVGQSQSEVSEVVGGRRVGALRVLERICDGLGIPRSHMGLGPTPVSQGTAAAEHGWPLTSASGEASTGPPPGAQQAAAEGEPASGWAVDGQVDRWVGGVCLAVLSPDEAKVLLHVLRMGMRVAGLRYGAALSGEVLFEWTGARAGALRQAYRYPLREWGAKLGVAHRTLSKWEAGARPGSYGQRALDAMLRAAPADVVDGFLTRLAATDGDGLVAGEAERSSGADRR